MPCQTVTVEANDESNLSISAVDATTPSPRTIEVTTDISNNIVSGSGTTITPTLQITVNGQEVFNSPVQSPSPGQTVSLFNQITDVEPASNIEICANLV